MASALPRYQCLPTPLLRGHGRDVVAQQRRHPPGLATCRSRLCDLYWVSTTTLQVAGVDDVRQREVDQPVEAAERHRGLGAVRGQRHQSLALATCEDDCEDLRLPCGTP